MVHTTYHFTVSAPHLGGALERLSRFFIDPLLATESMMREVENGRAGVIHQSSSCAR